MKRWKDKTKRKVGMEVKSSNYKQGGEMSP